MTDIKGYRWSVIIMTAYNAVFFGVRIISASGGSGGYILSALCTVAALIVYPLLLLLVPEGRMLRGAPLGAVLGGVLALCALVSASAASAYTARLIGDVFMKRSPFPYLLTLTALPAFVGTYFGFKAVSRYAYIGGHLIFFAAAVILMLSFEEYDRDNLYPIFGSISIKDLLIFPAVFAPTVYLTAISAAGAGGNISAECAKTVLVCGAAMTAICLVYNLTVPREALTLFENPLLVTASVINFDFVFERCEALVMIIWLFLSYLNICALSNMAADILAKSFALSCRNAAVGVVFGIIFAAALIADRLGMADDFFAVSAIFGGAVSIALPVCAAVFSGRRGHEKN